MVSFTGNWAGNLQFQAGYYHRPETVEEIQEIVRKSQHVKAVGARHSFSPIADTRGDLISMENFNNVRSVDQDRMQVTVEAGMPYGTFCAQLHEVGYAVHNMASLPQITVGGACATATHGSGDQNGNLATAVTAMTLVTATGDVVEIDRERDPDDFRAIVVGLGGFGIVLDLTLKIQPTFSVRQDIYEQLPLTKLLDNFDEIMALGYSVSLFTDWQGDFVNQLWIKRILDANSPASIDREIHGATLAETRLHPLPEKSAESCTDQLGASGPWHERLPHFTMDALGTAGDELQTEYFVARSHAREALETVGALEQVLAPIIKTSEIRSVAEDDLWMSPSYTSACVGIHFTWKPDWTAVRKVSPVIEDALAPYSPRPHWGKLFTLEPASVAQRYPRFAEFQNMMRQYDPDGRFTNAFLDRYILQVDTS
jgi:alditol oxidase